MLNEILLKKPVISIPCESASYVELCVNLVDDGQCCAVEWAGSLYEGCTENKIETGQKWKLLQTDLLLFKYLLFLSNFFSLFRSLWFFVATGLCCIFAIPLQFILRLDRKSYTREKIFRRHYGRQINSKFQWVDDGDESQNVITIFFTLEFTFLPTTTIERCKK